MKALALNEQEYVAGGLKWLEAECSTNVFDAREAVNGNGPFYTSTKDCDWIPCDKNGELIFD